MKALLLLALLVAAWAWVDSTWLTQRKVDALYADQVAAWRAGDAQALCEELAPDFRGTERRVDRNGEELLHPDRAQACASVAALLQVREELGPAGHPLPLSVALEVEGIEIARDRRSADVHVHRRLDVGGLITEDSRGVEHVVIRRGAVLLSGREGWRRIGGALKAPGVGA